MTSEQISRLISQWIDAKLLEGSVLRAQGGPWTERNLEDMDDGLDMQLDANHEQLVTSDYSKVEEEVTKLAGEKVDRETFNTLAHELLKAKKMVLELERQRWNGDYATLRPDEVRASAPSSAGIPPPPQPSKSVTKLFSEVSALYLNAHSHRVPRNQRMIEAKLKSFVTLVGDKPIGALTWEDFRAFKDHEMKKGNVAGSVNKHLGFLCHCMLWARKERLLPMDWREAMVLDLKLSKHIVRSQRGERVPFTQEELITIFTSRTFMAWKDSYPDRYFSVLALLCTAARAGEVCQLDLSAIHHDTTLDVYYFHFTNLNDEGERDADKSQKNLQSRRVCPVSALLMNLGFIRYVDQVRRRRGETKVFPQLKPNSNGYSEKVGRAWRKLLKDLQLKRQGLTLHSLRHTGTHRMEELGIPTSHVMAVTGHGPVGATTVVHRGYTHADKFGLKVLKEAVDRLGETYREVLKGLLP